MNNVTTDEHVEADYTFEVSWEVCNKVGGIYTVIKSKASAIMDASKNYFCIGPYFDYAERVDFAKKEPPSQFRLAFEELKREGIVCSFGIWEEVKGKPFAILVDFRGIIDQKNAIKGAYWNDYGIDTLRGFWDFEEPCLWSYAVGKLLKKLQDTSLKEKKIVAQFHEWLGAFGLLYLKKNCPQIATVFTTHATVLGRTLAGNGRDLYAILNSIDPRAEAYQYSVEAKHLTERAAALNADIFTTVSEITALEAERFLGRKPEVLVLNGLDIEKFPSFEQTSIQHTSSRERLREFMAYYFFPYYAYDVEHNLVFYTVGRFEFRNKGYDILIKALGQLNSMMKRDKEDAMRNSMEYPRTVCMFFWIPMEHHGLKLEVLENKNYYMHIKHFVNSHEPEIMNRIIYDALSKKTLDSENTRFFTESFLNEMKKDVIAFERKGSPPLSTHNVDERNNILFGALRENGLLNREEDLVKVIVEPVYLDGNDGFIELEYYDAMAGCHLGLFPSYYEPWGYTPLESAALGVPSVTTDLSGFGMFIKSKHLENNGLYVLDRFNRDEEKAIADFAKLLHEFSKTYHTQRVELKLAAKKVSANADWNILIRNYVKAYNLAATKDPIKKTLAKVN